MTTVHEPVEVHNFEGFEGPEKRLEIDFLPNPNLPEGLRALSREQLNELCSLVHCEIISTTSNDHFDSYVLSESSLFVYPLKFVMKTCGTTTLLNCLGLLEKFSKHFDLAMEYVWYSRRNYLYPDKQKAPHCSFEQEISCLNDRYDNGQAYVIGPVTSNHWNLYVADLRQEDMCPPASSSDEETHVTDDHMCLGLGSNATKRSTTTRVGSPTTCTDDYSKSHQIFEIMMSELDPTIMRDFYRQKDVTATDLTLSSGLAAMFPGAVFDACLFDPCGYSMNGMRDDTYCTVHVTPEPECSFVSYETNERVESWTKLVHQSVRSFNPRKFTLTVVSDPTAMCGHSSTSLDTNLRGYRRQFKATYELEGGRSVTVCNFVRTTPTARYLNHGAMSTPFLSQHQQHQQPQEQQQQQQEHGVDDSVIVPNTRLCCSTPSINNNHNNNNNTVCVHEIK